MDSAAQSRVATSRADSVVPTWHERSGAGEEAMLRMDGVSGSHHPRTFVPRCGEKAGNHSLPHPRAHILPCPSPQCEFRHSAWGLGRNNVLLNMTLKSASVFKQLIRLRWAGGCFHQDAPSPASPGPSPPGHPPGARVPGAGAEPAALPTRRAHRTAALPGDQ